VEQRGAEVQARLAAVHALDFEDGLFQTSPHGRPATSPSTSSSMTPTSDPSSSKIWTRRLP